MDHFCNIPISEETINYGIGQHPLGTIRRMIRLGRKQGIEFIMARKAYIRDPDTGHRIVLFAMRGHLFLKPKSDDIQNFTDFWEKVHKHTCACGRKIEVNRRMCMSCAMDMEKISKTIEETVNRR